MILEPVNRKSGWLCGTYNPGCTNLTKSIVLGPDTVVPHAVRIRE